MIISIDEEVCEWKKLKVRNKARDRERERERDRDRGNEIFYFGDK